MARQLKKLEIEEVVHNQTKQKAKIFFDRNRNLFCATVAETEYTDEVKDKLFTKVYKALGDFSGWNWKPFIVVRVDVRTNTLYGHRHEKHFQGAIDFEFWRVEVATKPNGDEVERPLLDEEGLSDSDHIHLSGIDKKKDVAFYKQQRVQDNKRDRESGRDLSSYHDWGSERNSVKRIPFDENVWQALHAIKARIELAQQQLEDLIKTEDLAKKLLSLSMAQPLSLPPKQE